MTEPASEDQVEEIWRWALTDRHFGRFSRLPAGIRCTVCSTPFSGISGRLADLTGRRPSSLNPHLCNYCDDKLPAGGAEVDVAILFADVRGSTALAETMSARDYSRLLNRFYDSASSVLIRNRAVIDKLIGDEVMAFFVPSSNPGGYRRAAVQSAVEILQSVGYRNGEEPWIPLAAGVHAGDAFVGKVGTEGVNSFTVLGDTVNIAARFRSEAVAGEILLSDDIYQSVVNDYPDLPLHELSMKGKAAPVPVRSLRLDDAAR